MTSYIGTPPAGWVDPMMQAAQNMQQNGGYREGDYSWNRGTDQSLSQAQGRQIGALYKEMLGRAPEQSVLDEFTRNISSGSASMNDLYNTLSAFKTAQAPAAPATTPGTVAPPATTGGLGGLGGNADFFNQGRPMNQNPVGTTLDRTNPAYNGFDTNGMPDYSGPKWDMTPWQREQLYGPGGVPDYSWNKGTGQTLAQAQPWLNGNTPYNGEQPWLNNGASGTGGTGDGTGIAPPTITPPQQNQNADFSQMMQQMQQGWQTMMNGWQTNQQSQNDNLFKSFSDIISKNFGNQNAPTSGQGSGQWGNYGGNTSPVYRPGEAQPKNGWGNSGGPGGWSGPFSPSF